jgi:hypothetical protein
MQDTFAILLFVFIKDFAHLSFPVFSRVKLEGEKEKRERVRDKRSTEKTKDTGREDQKAKIERRQKDLFHELQSQNRTVEGFCV